MMSVPRLLRRGVATAATTLVAVLAVSGVGAPALAHGGDGTLEVVTTIRQGDDVFVRVRLTYVADGHGVPDATVTAVAAGGTPVTMAAEDQEGLYSGAVPAEPGEVIRVSSVEPATSVEIEAPALEDDFPVLPSGPDATSTTTTSPPTTEAETTTTASDGDGGGSTTVTDDGDDGSGALPIVIGGVVVAGLVAGLAFALTRKGPDDDGDDQPRT